MWNRFQLGGDVRHQPVVQQQQQPQYKQGIVRRTNTTRQARPTIVRSSSSSSSRSRSRRRGIDGRKKVSITGQSLLLHKTGEGCSASRGGWTNITSQEWKNPQTQQVDHYHIVNISILTHVKAEPYPVRIVVVLHHQQQHMCICGFVKMHSTKFYATSSTLSTLDFDHLHTTSIQVFWLRSFKEGCVFALHWQCYVVIEILEFE